MDNEQERIIEQILWGKCIIDVADADGKYNTFILRSLTIKESNYSQYIYSREYKKAIENNIMPQEALIPILAAVGIDIVQYDKQIAQLEIDMKRAKAQIKHYEYFTAKKKQSQKELNKIEKEMENIRKEKEHILSTSAESRAEEIRRRYIVMLSTETIDENKFWKTEADFLQERDSVLIYNLAIAYYTHNIFDLSTLRKIARSSMWRFRWGAAKNGADLFGKPISEWSEMQNLLVYWSQFYDFVFESPDRPSEVTIEDDAACDVWVDEQNKKYNNMQTKGKTTRSHQEQFVMVAPGDKEAITKVQNMNTETTRMKLQSEHEIIKKKGKISDWQLRKGKYDK